MVPFVLAAGACLLLIAGCGSSGSRAHASSTFQAMLGYSRCMRSHGVTGFPDPTSTPPASATGYSIMEGLGSNLFLLVPSSIDVNSPVFRTAAKACRFH